MLKTKTMQKYGVTLAIFAAALTGFTALVNEITQSIIYKQAEQHKKAFFNQIIPATYYDNDLTKSCFRVLTQELGQGEHRIYIAKKNNRPVGVVMEVIAPDGYLGAIKLLVSTDFSGTVLGTRVIEHHETPGLGDKIEVRLSDWILSFAGKIINSSTDPYFAVKKDGGIFEQFTGATITPRAVVNAVKKAGLYAKSLPEYISTLTPCEH